jgi:PAS domain S-box-containing protein
VTHPLKFSSWPLRAKLAAFFLVVSLLPVTALVILEIHEVSGWIYTSETDLLAARAEQLAGEIDAFHVVYQHHAARLAATPNVQELLHAPPSALPGLADALIARLGVHLAVDPAIRGIAVLDAGARAIASTEPQLASRTIERGFAREALSGRAVISDVFVEHELADAPTIAYLAPVRDADRAVIGAVAFWIRADAMWELTRRITGLAGADSYAVVYDHDGVRIAHSAQPELVFRPSGWLPPAVIERMVAEQRFGPTTRALLGDVRSFAEAFARARAAALDPSVFEGQSAADRSPHCGVGRRLTTVPWTAFYLVPSATMAEPLSRATHRRLAFAMLAGFIALVAGAWFAQRIATPIAQLTAATRRLARGDLAVRVPPTGSDEIGALGAAFNAMAGQLRQSHTGLEALVGQRTAALVDANRTLREREHRLVASEQRVRDIYEHSPDMYATVEIATHAIVECNRTLCERTGYGRAELIGRPFYALYHPEFQATAVARIKSLADHQHELSDAERVLRCKDGTSIVTGLSVRPMRDQSGRIVHVQAVWRDITARKQSENDQQFLLGLADVLRSTADAGEVLLPVCERLAAYVGASRVLFAEIDQAHDTAMIHRDYHGEQASVSGVLPLSYFGRELVDEARRGQSAMVSDTAADPRTASSYATAYGPLGIRSLVSVPLLRDGTWSTTLGVATAEPRVWQEREIALVKLVAERVWGSVEHLRLLAELREQSVREAEQDTEARVLRAKQGELAKSLKEREVLLQEVHHRVKNNLQVISSLINMQTRQLDPGASRSALEQCQTRVLAIALIHEKLYQSQDYSAVHFAEYARSLAANVFHALGISQTHVTLEVAIEDIPIGVDSAIPCGLVINELITNALKHAFPCGRGGTIRVGLGRIAGGRVCLRVDDDGVGVPPGFDVQIASSMGLQLVCTLAEQLEGELAVIGGSGTSFQLTFDPGVH